jgi:diaminopimelate decarboxylase
MDPNKVRENLHKWLVDLAALKPHVDPSNPDAEPFLRAWRVVLEQAKRAANEYAEVFGE